MKYLVPSVNMECSIELCNHFFIPITVKVHDCMQIHPSTGTDHRTGHWHIKFIQMLPVYRLHLCGRMSLGHDDDSYQSA